MTESMEKNIQGAARKPLPRWKKGLLAASAVLFVLGAGLKGYAYFRGDGDGPERRVSADPSKRARDPLDIGSSLTGGTSDLSRDEWSPDRLPGGGGAGGAGVDGADEEDLGQASSVETYSPALMKGGMSFFIGFCMGFAVRTFFRISAFVIGAALLLVFALMYFGVMPQPDWAALEEHFNRVASSLWDQASGFRKFVEGNLPSTGAAAAGLFTGFKRN